MDFLIKEFGGDLKTGSSKALKDVLQLFEPGVAFRGMQISAQRIAELVQSMKNYARQGSSEPEEANIIEGLLDTMLILSNRLKNEKLHSICKRFHH